MRTDEKSRAITPLDDDVLRGVAGGRLVLTSYRSGTAPVTFATPDVCKDPAPPSGPVPVPYPTF